MLLCHCFDRALIFIKATTQGTALSISCHPAFKHHTAPVTRNACHWCPKAVTHMLVSVKGQRPGLLVSILNRGIACPDLAKVPDTKPPAFPRGISPLQQLRDTGTVSRCKDSSQADTTLRPAEQSSIMISSLGQTSWVVKVQAAHYGHQRQARHGKGETDPLSHSNPGRQQQDICRQQAGPIYPHTALPSWHPSRSAS